MGEHCLYCNKAKGDSKTGAIFLTGWVCQGCLVLMKELFDKIKTVVNICNRTLLP
jgi:hypothetical protein